jgi:hypothetical protein
MDRSLVAEHLEAFVRGGTERAEKLARYAVGPLEQAGEVEVDAASRESSDPHDATWLTGESPERMNRVAAEVKKRAPSVLKLKAMADAPEPSQRVKSENATQSDELADRSVGDKPAQEHCLRVVAIREPLRQYAPHAIRQPEQSLSVVPPPSQRLFAQHVLARFKRTTRPLNVRAIRQGDIERIDVRIVNQRIV